MSVPGGRAGPLGWPQKFDIVLAVWPNQRQLSFERLQLTDRSAGAFLASLELTKIRGSSSARDIVQFQYVHASVDRVNSAVQFGQGARFTSGQLLVGAPESELSDEVYLQYSHVFNPKRVATAFVSRSSPGDGLKAAALQGTEAWTTVGIGLTASF